MHHIAPLDGWLLDEAVALDVACPGFAGFLLRASAERRHVCAAFLAVTEVNEANRAEVGVLLRQADHRTILTAAFGCVPPGLRRALAKTGIKSPDTAYYKRLHRVLANGPTCAVATIKQLKALHPGSLAIIESLPKDLVDHRIVARLHCRDQAADLAKVVELMEARGIDRPTVVTALTRSTATIEKVIQRWTLRLPLGAGPIPECRGFRPIKDGVSLREVALRYRNCSRHYLLNAIAGENAFGEYTHGDGRNALVRFERRNGIWHLDGAYLPRNKSTPDDIKQSVQKLAGRYGILEWRESKSRDAMAALRSFSRSIYDW